MGGRNIVRVLIVGEDRTGGGLQAVISRAANDTGVRLKTSLRRERPTTAAFISNLDMVPPTLASRHLWAVACGVVCVVGIAVSFLQAAAFTHRAPRASTPPRDTP